MNPEEWTPQRYVSLIPTFCCRTGWHNFVVFVGFIEKYVLIQILRVQILNTLILIMSPWGWVGEGIGLNAKSTPRRFQKKQNCWFILTWQLRPEPSSGRRPWRWPRSPSWWPAPSGRSSGWLLRRASPAFPWSYSRWKLGSALSSDPGSVWIENLSKQELHLPLLSVRLLQSPVLLIRRGELVRREIVKALHLRAELRPDD